MKSQNIIEFRSLSKKTLRNQKAASFVAFEFFSLKKKGLQIPVFTCKL